VAPLRGIVDAQRWHTHVVILNADPRNPRIDEMIDEVIDAKQGGPM
jgi:hypothetical protein